MELNGIHNLIMKVNKFKDTGRIGVNQANELLEGLKLFDRYVTAFHYRPQTNWHEVIKNPELFPLNSEVQHKVWVAIKAAKSGEEEIAWRQVIKEIYGDIK
jgi:hypothetical protein